MQKLGLIAIWTVLGLGCGGSNALVPGSSEDADDPVICVGDPDSQMICKKASEFWDCTQMPNGDVKCVHRDTQTPPGDGSWTCIQDGGQIVCTTNTPNAPVPGGSGWTCTSTETTTTCVKDGPVPPGGGAWDCTLEEFVWSCTGDEVPPGSGTGSAGTGGGTSVPGTSNTGGTTPPVCTQWFAVKWGIGGATAGSCEAIPSNEQDCDEIRALLDTGLPGPLTNGACDVVPVKSGDSWVVTLPATCQFLEVCGKYGGNTFLSADGTTTVTIPAQLQTGLSHFEFIWCC